MSVHEKKDIIYSNRSERYAGSQSGLHLTVPQWHIGYFELKLLKTGSLYCTQYASKLGKLSSGHSTGKLNFSSPVATAEFSKFEIGRASCRERV